MQGGRGAAYSFIGINAMFHERIVKPQKAWATAVENGAVLLGGTGIFLIDLLSLQRFGVVADCIAIFGIFLLLACGVAVKPRHPVIYKICYMLAFVCLICGVAAMLLTPP